MVAVTVRPTTDRESNQGGAEAARSYSKADTDQITVPLHYAGAGAGGVADPNRGVSRAPHGTRLP